MSIKEENCIISSVFLGYEEHGIFTFTLVLEGNGWAQGAGQYCLDRLIKKKDNKRVGTAGGLTCIMRILDVLDVDSWEKLKGKNIRCRRDSWKVHEIGHLIKEKWLNFDDFFRKYEK